MSEACKTTPPNPTPLSATATTLKDARELKVLLKTTSYKDIPIYLVPPAIVVHAGPDLLSMSCFLTQEKH